MRGILVGAGGVGLAAAALLLRPSLLPLPAGWAQGLAAGALLGTAGSLAGFLWLLRNMRGSHGRFLMVLFGGMLARWVVFGGVVVVVALGEAVPIAAFLSGLIPSYLGFQAMEMWTLHRMQEMAGSPAGAPASERSR